MIAGIVEWILGLHGAAALAVVFLVPALEASAFVGFVFPGEVAVLLGGVLAYQGRIPLPAAIAAAVLGAVIGDSIGYLIGHHYGRRLLRAIVGRVPVVGRKVDEHLDKAEEFLRRRRGSAVFFGRFTAALRVMVPGLAGMSGIPFGQFAMYNVAGGALWGTGFVLAGFFAGAAWQRAEGIATKVGLALLAALLVAVVLGRVLKVWRAAEAAQRGPVARARRRWPRQVRWVERRLEPVPTGFPLSVAIVVSAGCVWTFAAMTQDVRANEEAALLDPGVMRFATDHRAGWLTAAMKAVTLLGSNWVAVPLAVALGGWLLLRRRDGLAALGLGASVGGAIVLYEGFKAWVERPRPPFADRLITVAGPSFPSGHATQVVACYVMVAVVLGARRSWRVRSALGAAAGLIALLVGVSRIYLGVHWLTDVLAGWTLGGAWVSLLLVGALLTTAPDGSGSGRSPGSPSVAA